MVRVIDLRNEPPAASAATQGIPVSAHSIPRSLDPHGIAFITAVKDEEQYRICLRYLDALEIPPGYTVERIGVLGGASMAECYQRAMEASSACYKIYLHVDTYVVHRGLLPELLHLFGTYPRLGLVGVSGATRLPARVLLSVNNPLHCYGRHWAYRRPGGPSLLLGPANRRRLDFSRFRSFVSDYLPAVAIDGFFMATRYDIPWVHPAFGFDLYDQVQSLEFMKLGLEVGIARQETIWCVHWGPLQEPSREEHRRRWSGLYHKAGVFRQLYPAFVRVPAGRLYQQYRGSRDFKPDPGRERLSVVVVASDARGALLRSLRTLWPQCEALTGIDCHVVVVDNASTHETIEAVRREFPRATVITNNSNGGPERGFNMGLKDLGFPSYVLIMHDIVEIPGETLSRMVSYLKEHPLVAGVVASLTNRDGTLQSQRTAIVELLPRRLRRAQVTSFVPTTCALVRGGVFFDVGLYDERFNSHNADLEWSLRARRKGYRFAFLPEVRVIHDRDMRSYELRPDIVAERFTANLWLLYKHGGRRWAAALYWAQRLLAKWLAFRWRNDSGALRQLNEAMARAKRMHRMFHDENRRPQLL